MERGARARSGASHVPRHRHGTHAHQSTRGPRTAGVVENPHRRDHRQTPRQPVDAARRRGGRRDHHSGRNVVRARAGREHRRATRDHRNAQTRAGARAATAGVVFRFDEVRCRHFAHHDGCRRRTEPRRNGTRTAPRQHSHRDHGGGRPVLPELEAHERDTARVDRIRHDDDAGVHEAASAVSRARRDQRRSHGPPRRDDRRRSPREGVRR